MNGGDDDLVARQTTDDFEHVLAVLGRQAGSRFIKQVHVGDADHVEPRIETLALATTEEFLLRRACQPVTQIGQAKFRQLRIHTFASFLGFQMRTAHGHREIQIFLYLQQRIKGILLRNVSDVGREIVQVVIQREAVHQHFAALGFELPAENAQQRALAATAGPHDADHLTTPGDEAHTILRGVPAIEAVAELAHFNLAHRVALLFDDAIGKVAAQVLSLSERDGVTVIEGDPVTHRNQADVERT